MGRRSRGLFIVAALFMAAFGALAARAPDANAYLNIYTNNCQVCHGTTTTCNGCHHHGPRNLLATTNSSTYAPGAPVTVSFSGGSQSGWIRAILYLNNVEVARSSGPSGLGGGAGFPITFQTNAPSATGTYTYEAAWFGNSYDTGNPSAASHAEVRVSTNQFTVASVDSTPPTVSATVPANNATNVAVNANVTATFSEAVAASSVTASTFTLRAGSSPVAGAVSTSGSTVTFNPTANLAYATTYTATLTTGITDVAGNALTANYVWSFTTGPAPDTTRPTVSSTNPASNATNVAVNGSVTATFSEPVAASSVTTSTFTLRAGTSPVAGTVSTSGATVTFTPTGSLSYGTIYTATLTTGITDLASNALAANYVWSFTTGAAPDTTRPTVQSTTPANSAANVATNVKPSVTFSEAVDPATITTASFTLSAGGTPVSGSVSVSGATAVFTPGAALPYSTNCTATVTTAVKDLAGNALASNYSWSFTTGAAPDTTPPSIASTDPVSGATGVPVGTAVAANFSEAIDPASVTTANFTLKAGTTPVAGTVAVSGARATFQPSAPLAYSTAYTATIGAGVKDLSGNATTSATTWTFTTGAAQDTTPPTVSSTSPAGGATGVSVNSLVTATFSEPVAAITVTAASFTLKAGATPVTGTVSTNGATVTFTPAAALGYDTAYTATLTTAIKDLAGNALAAAHSWSFTTGSQADTTPPTVSATSPASGAAAVPVSSAVTATFSEALDAATVNATTFGLKDASNNTVAGSVAYVGTTATFSPTAPLAASATYTATVTTGVKDLAGNAMAAPYSWSFTTAAASGDRDGDGVSDAEDDYPDDARKATPRVSKGNGKILIDVSSHPTAYLREVTAISDSDPALNQVGKPTGRQFILGLVSYKVVNIPVGATVNVRLVYPVKIDDGSEVYMVGPDGFHLLEDAAIDGKAVNVKLTDGGRGDRDGTANGVIVDPIGVASPVAPASSSSGGGCSVAGAGQAAGALPGAFGLLPLAGLWLARLARRRSGERR